MGKFLEILTSLFSGQKRYSQKKDSHFFKKFLTKQTPYITLLTCSDSRVQSEIFGIDPTNAIFCVRNIGNQLINNLGSVDYGIIHLQTPLLIILGHVRCGAVTAALGDYSEENTAVIGELNGLCIPIRRTLEDNRENFELQVERAVLENMHYQVDLAVRRYRDRIERGKLTVIGAVYDFGNFYGKGFGRVLPVNVNGKKSVKEILERVDKKEKAAWENFLKENFLEV